MITLNVLTKITRQHRTKRRQQALRRRLASLPDHVRRDIGVAQSGDPFDPRRLPRC